MDQFKRLSELDIVSRVAVINIVVILSYVLIICVLLPLATGADFDAYVFSFEDAHTTHMNIIAILSAVLIGSVLALLIRPRRQSRDARDEALRSMLSDDEQHLLSIVEEAKEITQDSLVFRLEWSRAKVSTTVTGLERMGVVQRRREGKTYVILLAKR